MDKTTNSLNWFAIPVKDLSRAQKFYETIFNLKMDAMPDMEDMQMTAFPSEMGSGKANGCLTKSQMYKPSMDGVIIYLNANPSIQEVIDRIDRAGGRVVMPKMDVGNNIGFMAMFIDTEGNKIGLHAQH